MSDLDPEEINEALLELVGWGAGSDLNALSSMFWRTDNPPEDSWSGVVLLDLDCAPNWGRLSAAYQWALELVPRLSERVVEPLLPTGPPRWSRDPDFDPSHHLRRVAVPSPGDRGQLLELAQQIALTPLDRNRPPWVAYLVEGLKDGRAAVLFQGHHVLMDGSGMTQLFGRLLNRTREHIPGKPRPGVEPHDPESRWDVALHGIRGQVRGAPRVVRNAASGVAAGLTRPGEVVDYVRSFARVTTPPPSSRSPLLSKSIRRKWRFTTMDVPLADLKAAGKAVGGTVNDAFVSALLGGLRDYHVARDLELDDVPISMPVSMRLANDPIGSNRFAAATFSAPAAIADPGDRIRAMRERVAKVRTEPALDYINAVTPAMNYAPTPLVCALLNAVTEGTALTTSCWVGVEHDIYVAGARVEGMYAFPPLPHTTLFGACCTHIDTACMSFNADGDVYTDTELLWESMRKGVQEVLALGA